MIERDFVILNEIGLHARPAAKLTQVASKYKSEIILIKDNKMANAKSLLSVLALGIFKGTKFSVRISGSDEIEAMLHIKKLIENNFK